MKNLVPFLILFSHFILYPQVTDTTPASDMQEGIESKTTSNTNALVKNIPFKNIGPTIMSGRVVDIEINPERTSEFYVAYASGGLWYTNTNGIHFKPILDNADTINIGDIAVDWKNGTIWVGTGENNSSRSSYAGIGILKSTDQGKTWQKVGLLDSHHIGRILINPSNPNEVIIGVIGHLYSTNEERGIYKTLDGGNTWKKTLHINEKTGIIDVAFTPDDFNIMYAASWERDRKAWNFNGNGADSAIYKSTDGGATWSKITVEQSGFPIGRGVGRIGLAVFDKNVVYAVVDNQNRRPKNKTNPKVNRKQLTKESFEVMAKATLLNLEDKKLNTFLKINKFHKKYTASSVKKMIRKGEAKPMDLFTYLQDDNQNLFDTPVIGAEVYRSNDGGQTWARTHANYIDDFFYSYGYYFSQIRVSPKNKDHIYITGVPLLKSKDGGKTFESISAENVHSDHHSLWINPNNTQHLINGNDGGVNISYDDGLHWIKANQPSVGQFYSIYVDQQIPYHVYGGLQDNGVWMGKNTSVENTAWHQKGQYPWKMIMGGDGMQTQVDSRDTNIVYTGFQFGNYYRLDLKTSEKTSIKPKHEIGSSPYRFNWQTPILLSKHNEDILYMGANSLLRSMNKGDDWVNISKDLTKNEKKGNVPYGTLTSISESPFQFGLLYTGSDDGLIHVSRNGGSHWELISKSFPQNLWVSKVIASQHKKERVYVTLNGYRWDDFKPYIFKSDDYGKTWDAINSNLPASPINVIKEDPNNENILYIGTDHGAYASINQGKSWEGFSNGLPPVAVHDLVIQSPSNDLLLATHGRGIYKTNISALQELNKDILTHEIHLFNIKATVLTPRYGDYANIWSKFQKTFIPINYYVSEPTSIEIKIKSKEGKILNEFNTKVQKGINYHPYDLALNSKGKAYLEKKLTDKTLEKDQNDIYYLPIGIYEVSISNGSKEETTTFEIK